MITVGGMVSDQWEASAETQQPIIGWLWSASVWVVSGWWQLVSGGPGLSILGSWSHRALYEASSHVSREEVRLPSGEDVTDAEQPRE